LDSLTHIVLGACIGEAVAGRNFGKKAMLAGALAQSIPDVDFITRLYLAFIIPVCRWRAKKINCRNVDSS